MANELLSLQPINVWKHFHALTQIPRPTGHMETITRYIIDFSTLLGLKVKQDKAGNVVVCKPASLGMENAPTVILQSHLDMVPQKNNGTIHDFSKDPLNVYIDGNKVKAKGTTLGADNGIGVAAMMAILEDVNLIHGPLEALFTIDEEEGMTGAFGLEPDLLSGKIMLNLDSEEFGELCIGGAGGVDITATFRYKEVEVPAGDVAVKINLTGLKGGHSGTDIHLGRANANKLIFRFLKEAVRFFEARLAIIDGGSLRNAIPREAFAVVTVPQELQEELIALCSHYEDIYKEEYKGIEDFLSFKAGITEIPETLLPEEIQDNLINAVEGCPDGVINMFSDFPGVVETSVNMASVKTTKEMVRVGFLARSASETKKEAVVSSVESVFSLAGAKVEVANPYPGWKPDPKSPTLHTMADLYLEMSGKPAHIKVVHAGLECGLILEKMPDIDIVSFGPTIVNPHSPDEYVDIATVKEFYVYLIRVLENIK